MIHCRPHSRCWGSCGLTILMLLTTIKGSPVSAAQFDPATFDSPQSCCQSCCVDTCGFDTTAAFNNNNNGKGQVIHILSYDTGYDLMDMQKSGAAYYEKTGIKVVYDLVPDFNGLYDEIRSQMQEGLPLYDGFISGPAIVGTAVQLNGFLDLTDIVRDREDLKWLDVLMGFRERIATYDTKVRMFPLDGDAHYMFYRGDVLEAFNLTVPRTWDEYWQVAKAVHGKEYNGQTMVGSCVGRKLGGHLGYWASLILSSYTQTQGPTQGYILDTKDMTPLMGEAMAEVLKQHELQAMYGHPREFETTGGGEQSAVNIEAMNSGYCALTYNWGDSYKLSHSADPQSQIIGLLSVAPSPGTTKVYNRHTKKLEPCNEDNCGGVGGKYYDDIGWVNRASYLAFGGWSASVNNNINDAQKQLIVDFFVWMCGPETSLKAAVPNASAPMKQSNGVDPFRTSHMNVRRWVEQGYERASAESYKKAVEDTLGHPNSAIDMRFAGADLVFSTLEDEVYHYLEQAVLLGNLPDDEEERQKIRMQVANTLEKKIREIIMAEDSKPETQVPLLEQFQRDLGIYKVPNDDNKDNLVLAIVIPIVVAILVGAALLVYFQKKNGTDDSVWLVKKEELSFADAQEIIGRGTFGLVLLAEYRGTKVAVKRVLPPKQATNKKNFGSKSSTISLGKSSNHSVSNVDIESSHNEIGTTSWAGVNVPGMNSSQSVTLRSDGKIAGMSSGISKDSLVQSSSIVDSKNKKLSANRFHRTLKKEFVKEMRYLSKLRHPCITTVMGAVITPNEEPMLIMEYMESGSLADILHNKSVVLDGEIILPMLRDITQGCRFLHAANPKVIHGDLKAANILVDSKFRAKVADFGLSQKKQMGATGTPFWMAPELLRGDSTNTAESDVYSFGIILYEVFARKYPYEGEDTGEVLKQVADPQIHKRPPVPSNCPPQLAALMRDCVLDSPDERPTFEELDKRLRRVDIEEEMGDKVDRTTVSLFDIFPKHIAEALRDGKPVEAEHKDIVTLFFSDIVGFTDISSTLEPRKVANMLDRLYQSFDKLSDEHQVFKVETIGDAYMAVTNLVKDQAKDHAVRIANFAVDAVDAANEVLIDTDAPEKGYVNIRVGFHSGPVVADVVGSRNPRYCLFGDTVNTASRMESNSKVNRIHCSEQAAKYLEQQHCQYPVLFRGIIEVKGKGQMPTYWVNEGAKAVKRTAPKSPPEAARDFAVPQSALADSPVPKRSASGDQWDDECEV